MVAVANPEDGECGAARGTGGVVGVAGLDAVGSNRNGVGGVRPGDGGGEGVHRDDDGGDGGSLSGGRMRNMRLRAR